MDLVKVMDNLNKLYTAEQNYYRAMYSHSATGFPSWNDAIKTTDDIREPYDNLVELGFDKSDLFNFVQDAVLPVKASFTNGNYDGINNDVDLEK